MPPPLCFGFLWGRGSAHKSLCTTNGDPKGDWAQTLGELLVWCRQWARKTIHTNKGPGVTVMGGRGEVRKAERTLELS